MQNPLFHKPLLSSLVLSMMLVGCASTPKPTANVNDPWTGWNHGTQTFNDNLDKAIIKPLAKGYHWVTPDLVNQGISNFFSNINDIGVTANDIMQLKLSQGGQDAGRFLINTTAGVGGFVDIANRINLPKHKEDFGQTLGYWGVPSGNYLVLPVFGPSSPRDTVGLVGDALLNPLTYVSVFGGAAANAATSGARLLDITDHRDELMTTEKIINEGSVDRYDFIMNSYKQNREYLINDGKATDESDPDIEDDSNTSGKPATNQNPSSKGHGTPSVAPSNTQKPHRTLKLSEPKK